MARRWYKTPKVFFYVKHLILVKIRTADPCVTLYSSLCVIKGIKANPKIKKGDQFPERLIPPCRFFLAPCFSGRIPIWSMGARHVCLLAPVFKPTWEGAQGGAPSDIQVAPVAQRRWCKFLVLEFFLVSHVNQVIQPRFLSYYFLAEFPSVHGYPPSLLILPGLLRSDPGGLSASSPSGERGDTCGLHRWWLVFHVNQVIQPLFLC